MRPLEITLFLCLLIPGISGTGVTKDCRRLFDELPGFFNNIRVTYEEVREHFQSKDVLHNVTLWGDYVLRDVLGYIGCETVNEMLTFYLKFILPSAESWETHRVSTKVKLLAEKLSGFVGRMKKCLQVYPCVNFSQAVKNSEKLCREKKKAGVIKAMSEFDIMLNYMEVYITSKNKHSEF